MEVKLANNLSIREIEVLKFLAFGFSNVEIAKELSISIHTVKAHLESIYYKLSIHNRAQAAVFAAKNNIV